MCFSFKDVKVEPEPQRARSIPLKVIHRCVRCGCFHEVPGPVQDQCRLQIALEAEEKIEQEQRIEHEAVRYERERQRHQYEEPAGWLHRPKKAYEIRDNMVYGFEGYIPAPGHAPTFSTGQTHAPIQAVNGGYNHVAPPGPSQPLNATHPGSQYIAGPYMGPTKTELNYSMTTAIANEKPEEMVPAGTDPDRFYQVQELDGSWTRRNKRTIDGYLGPVKWNQRPDGTWFVIRLRDD